MTMPFEAPLLTINDAAQLVRRTPAAVRQAMKRAKKGKNDELGKVLRELRVVVGQRRVMINRRGLVEWLEHKAAAINQ